MSKSKAIALRRDQTSWSTGYFLLACAAFLLFMLFAEIAKAQDYDESPLDSEVTNWGRLVNDKYQTYGNMLSGAEPLNQQDFDSFFNDKVFPLFTQWKDRQILGKPGSPLVDGPPRGGTAGLRAQFKTTYLYKAKSPQAREELNKLTLEKMSQIASGKFHPVVRANAMLLIGDLNDTGEPGGPPWKAALPTLLKFSTAADTADVVRVEALRGLLRHAQAGIDADSRQKVVTGMLGLIQQHKIPEGRGQDGHDWICRRAIDVLAAIGDAGPNGSVVQNLIAVIDDPAASTNIRSAAAGALSKIKFTPPSGFDATKAAKSLGKLAVDCNAAELAIAATQRGPIVVDRLKQQLNEIRLGLNSGDGKAGVIAWSSAPEHQQLVNLIDGQIKNLALMCDTPPDKKKTADATMPGQGTAVIPVDTQKPIADALKTASDALQKVLEKGGAAAPAAGEAQPLGLN